MKPTKLFSAIAFIVFFLAFANSSFAIDVYYLDASGKTLKVDEIKLKNSLLKGYKESYSGLKQVKVKGQQDRTYVGFIDHDKGEAVLFEVSKSKDVNGNEILVIIDDGYRYYFSELNTSSSNDQVYIEAKVNMVAFSDDRIADFLK